ncbi:Poly(R)-hydroxyalkanoic acid synthase subunit (PHA_synth_III_E) [Caballeronia arvi]|uniref:Poly(3-hydroxyalkanoate) polymerase subunit PhaE n=1 Tax=Caballeronia arvi TaxID=1777135 RepID=A0A158KKS4_9BURK|nr:poly(R)-hydroxyalkanoic acid synthase subunit PhaE [Caballeronia arvi]SAL81343.1 Poly(R)-hydroxyalkanoic acid synthase subunit (PHA_synth_III_E) [Caballeronia arvi]
MSQANGSWADGWNTLQQTFFKSMFPSPSGASSDGSPQETTQFMQAQFADLTETWKASIEKWAAFAKDGVDPEAWTPTALREMFSPARWGANGTGAFDVALQHVIEGPKYATLYDLDKKLVELQHALRKRDEAVLAYQAIVQRAWNTAFERFMKTLATSEGATPNTWRGVTDRWLKIANETLIEAYRSEEFVKAQSVMLRTASEYRLQEREIAESWCEAYHIPTRTEVDEVHRTVTELRRQVRSLQRQIPIHA